MVVPSTDYSGLDPLNHQDQIFNHLRDIPPTRQTDQQSSEIENCLTLIEDAIDRYDGTSPDPDNHKLLITRNIWKYRDLLRPEQPDIDRILRLAIVNKKLGVVKQLLVEHGGNVQRLDILGRSAIFYLAAYDDFDVAKLVFDHLDKSIQTRVLDGCDDKSRTALWYAAEYGAVETATLLLSRGADPHTSEAITNIRVLPTVRLSQLAQIEPHISLCVSRYTKKTNLTSFYDCPISRFQKNLDCWSEDIRQSIQQETWEHHLTWIDCPTTNKDIVLALVRSLQRSIGKSDPLNHVNIEMLFLESFKSPSTQPNDPLLAYRDPYYQSNALSHMHFTSADKTKIVENKWFSISSLVFPCLVVQDISQQKMRRTWKTELLTKLSQGRSTNYELPFHMERTLDEAYYPGLSRKVLCDLNKSQVISREFDERSIDDRRAYHTSSHLDQGLIPLDYDYRPILMVSQLWIWKFDRYIISAFPSLNYNSNPISLLRRKKMGNLQTTQEVGIIEDSPKRQIGLAVADRIDNFGRGEEYPPALQIFEAGVARIMAEVSEYMDPQSASKPNIEKEREFLIRISDVQGELAMIQDVLYQQKEVLKGILNDPPSDFVPPDHRATGSDYESWDRVDESMATLNRYYRLTEKISADAARIENNIQNELNLKRTFATMDDARTSLSLGIAVIGFTVITIIFAPLAFVTALFALPLDAFEKKKVKFTDGTDEEGTDVYTTSYIGKWFATAELVSLGVTGLVVIVSFWWLGSMRKSNKKHPGNKRGAKGATSKDSQSEGSGAKDHYESKRAQSAFTRPWQRLKDRGRGKGPNVKESGDLERNSS